MPVAHQRQRRLVPPEDQPPATLNQAAPVQNTWYTILDTEEDVALYQIAVGVEDTNETLECRITIDGQTYTGGTAATHSTTYWVYTLGNAITRTIGLGMLTSIVSPNTRNANLEGRSVKVELRKTTAAGVGNLIGVVHYGEYTETDV